MTRLLTLVCCIALSTGCASIKSMMPGSNGTAGDQMISQAKETKALGRNWNDGKRMVEKANKLMSRSEELARESRKLKAEAEGLVARGNSLIEGSEKSYEVAFGDTPSFGNYPNTDALER